MTRRRYIIDSQKFNAFSLAIISATAMSMYMPRASAQMTAPSVDTARYMEAFERADKNGDGKLSKEESENLPAIAQRFEQIDTDKDGMISKAEYLEALKP